MWTKARRFLDLQTGERLSWGDIPECPGVYRIRCIRRNGRPRCVARARGVDKEGTLHIGRSVNIRRRLQEFWGQLTKEEGTRDRHWAGMIYGGFGFEERFPLEELHFDYRETGPRGSEKEQERLVREEYRMAYLDSPPLSGMVKSP